MVNVMLRPTVASLLAVPAVAAAFAATFFATERPALAANWYDGPPSRVQHVCNNFITTLNEDLVWDWVGFQDVTEGSTSRLPKTGETYYVRVVMGGLGCSGAWVHPELKLPKGTSFAVTPSTPIRCFVDRPNQPPRQPLPCPSAPAPGVYPSGGFYRFDAPNNQPYWALPNGNVIYIEVPVTSTQPLSGIATNDYLVAAVNVLDNNPGGGNPPWDVPNPPSSGPWQGVFVTLAGAPRSPYVSYADKSAIPGKDTATTDFTVNNADCVVNGNLQGDLLPVVGPAGSEAFVSGNCIAGCCGGNCPVGGYQTFRFSWNGLKPDTDYKWRGFLQSLTVANGCTKDLADAQANATAPQWAYFRTLPTSPKAAQYSLLLHASEGGTLAADPTPPKGQTRYQPGTVVTVTPTPGSGYRLATLKVDGVDTTAPASVTMNQDHAVEATFEPGSDADGGTGGDAGTPGGGGDGGGGGCSAAGGAPGSFGAAALAVVGALVLARRRRAQS